MGGHLQQPRSQSDLMAYTTREPLERDAAELAENLTPADREELSVQGLQPLTIIQLGIRHSLLPVSIIDRGGNLAGIAGTVPYGHTFDRGAPWLLTTPYCKTEPLAFVKQAREWVNSQLSIFPELSHEVYVRNIDHHRLLKLLGFTIDPPRDSFSLFLPFHQCAPQSP